MFDALVICGGGAKCIATLGMLGKLEMEGILTDVHTIAACSAGAYIAVLYLLGVKPIDILEAVPVNMKIGVDMEHLVMFGNRKGMFRIKRFTKRFREVVRACTKKEHVSLEELFEITGVTLFIQVTDIDTKEQIFLSHLTHPKTDLFDAVYASSSIPIIFTPVKINGRRCVDGGVVTSMPLEPVKDLKVCILDNKGITNEKENFFGYIVNVLKTPSTIKKREDLISFRGQYIIVDSMLSLLDFNDSDRNMQDFLYGWSQFNPDLFSKSSSTLIL